MARAVDVAEEIIRDLGGSVNAVVLEKVLYYCQVWSRVWRRQSIFSDRIEAWANGPVVPTVYARHRGAGSVQSRTIVPDPLQLTRVDRETVASVSAFYGRLSADNIILLSHGELPWLDARRRAKAKPGERCNEVITDADTDQFYGLMWRKGGKYLPEAPPYLRAAPGARGPVV